MTEIYLHFLFAHYGLYENAPVLQIAYCSLNRKMLTKDLLHVCLSRIIRPTQWRRKRLGLCILNTRSGGSCSNLSVRNHASSSVLAVSQFAAAALDAPLSSSSSSSSFLLVELETDYNTYMNVVSFPLPPYYLYPSVFHQPCRIVL